jgi:hypothetical protein
MSLISEALRKARQEAADRGDQDRGHGPPPTIIRLRPSSPLGFGLVVGASIALAAALVGAGAVWWALRAPVESVATDAPGEGEQPASTDSAPLEAAVVVAPEDEGSADPVAASGTAATTARSDPAPAAAPNPNVAEDSLSAEHGTPSESEQGRGQSQDLPIRDGAQTSVMPAAGQDQERVFIVEADLGYAFLSLDFIVFRSEDPFAEINGTEVHEGSWLDGFTVEEIERDRVLLRDARGPLVLRVR